MTQKEIVQEADTLEELDAQFGRFLAIEGNNDVSRLSDFKLEIFPDINEGIEEYKASLEHYLNLCKEGKIKHLNKIPELNEAIVNAHLDLI